MNIVMIGPFGMYPRTTMRVRALPLAKALVARGHGVTMLLPPWQNPEHAEKTWTEAGVHIENMPLPVGLPGWFHWQLTAALVRRTRELQPDVVHTFKPKAYAGFAHCALRRKFPVVVDTDDWEGPGGWNDLNPYPALLKRVFTWQERWGLRHARAVTVASRALQTLAWATGGLASRVFYLPNGVAWPYPPVTPVPHTRPTLLLYTRFFEFKLTRIWDILQNVRIRQPEVRVWFIGQGFFGEEIKFRSLAQEAGWNIADISSPPPNDIPPDTDLVYYAGWVAREDQPAHFAQADVALYPFEDTLINRTKCPGKLLDLLAAGVPVVADAVGQISENIRSGESGILVPPNQPQAFTEAILTLLNDAQVRQDMRQRAAEDVRNRFSWPTLAQTAEAAYQYALVHT